MTLHDLRHTAASMSISAGEREGGAADARPHLGPMTLDIYAGLIDDDLNAVSDRLDEAYERSSAGTVWAHPDPSVAQTER
jgi:hypothetical protein